MLSIMKKGSLGSQKTAVSFMAAKNSKILADLDSWPGLIERLSLVVNYLNRIDTD